MLEPTLYLRSGKWRPTVDHSAQDPVLELIDPGSPWNRMRVTLPLNYANLTPLEVQELARRPEVRFWADEHNLLWRVSVVGPGTRYPFPLRHRHLVFDSDQASAGIVRLKDENELGDLTCEELRDHRNRVSDVAGRRRRFRPPSSLQQRPTAGQTGGAGTE